MPVFQYWARAGNGGDNTGSLFAANEDVLYSLLRQQGLFLLRAKERKGSEKEAANVRLSHGQVLAFTIHMASFLEAGISLMDALQSISRENNSAKYQILIEGLATQIAKGAVFSEALAQFPRSFDDHYTQMIRIGETTGQLDERLREMVSHLEWQQELRSQVKQSSTYPLILIGLLALVVVILMIFTLPKFVKMLTQFNIPLPAPTRILITLSSTLSEQWYWGLAGLAIPAVVWFLLSISEQGRYFLDKFKLGIPLVGELHRKIALSRFAHHMSILNGAGIDMLSSLQLVERLVGNEVIARVIRQAHRGVEAGETLAHRLRLSAEFPSFVVQMLSAGEQTGNLDNTLKKVSQHYNREIPIVIKRTFTVLEPLVLVIMGGLVLFIAVAILLPIYEFGAGVK